MKTTSFFKRSLTAAAIALMTVAASAQDFPKVILRGDYPDPSIVRDGNDYYMTHSPFYYKPGFLIWHSHDLMNWQPVARALADWEGSAMAPDLVKVKDTFYIYFPSANTNWVTTAKNIKGPWSEPIDLKISGIDPGHIVTPDGKRFLFTSDGHLTKLTDDGLARDGETTKVYAGWQYPSDWNTECMCLESPKLTWHNGYYYMTSAQGGTAGPATSHMIVAARARSLNGPWENSPYNPIVHTWTPMEKWWSKGHGTLVEGPDGQWWTIYHAYERNAHTLGRQTLIEPIEWTEGGWYRPVPDYQNAQANIDRTKEASLDDSFAGNQLGWQWTGWKENIQSTAKVKNGTLTLPAKGSSPADGRLALITASDTDYAVEAEITTGKGSQAGLLLYYNENGFAGLVSDGNAFMLYGDSNSPQAETTPSKVATPKGCSPQHFLVRVENHSNSVDVLISRDGKQWTAVKRDIDVSEMHHNNLRGFFALRPALYAGGKGQAMVKNFKYERLKAGNCQEGDYGYLYCHMAGNGEYTAFAIGRDGYHYEDVKDGQPMFDNEKIARIEGGTRDAYIARSHNGKGYLMVTTDMCVGKSKKWFNYGIDLLRSDDLIHWESTTFDFRKGNEIFCDPASPDVYQDWSKIGRVWAPQFIWDPNYLWEDGNRGGYFIYYSLWNQPEEAYDRMYYSYADETFTKLTKPRLLFDWGYATIDADINYLESDGLYHMLIKKEGGQPGIFTTTAESLTGPWKLPVEDDYVSFEGKKKCEGSSAFQLIDDDTWRVAYVEYSSRPFHYRICQADRNMRNFANPVDIQGVKYPQHGSFMRINKDEYDRLKKLK